MVTACAHLAKSGLPLYLGPGRLQGEQVDRTARRTWVDTHIPKMDIGLWSGYWFFELLHRQFKFYPYTKYSRRAGSGIPQSKGNDAFRHRNCPWKSLFNDQLPKRKL